MALYNRASEVVLSLKPSKAPGWVIYSDFTNGSDTTGDGTEARPYQTMGAGAADLRNGKGDVLVLQPGIYKEAPVVIDSKSDITIIGFSAGTSGARIAEAGGGRRQVNVISAWTPWSTYGFQVTTTAGHGAQVGDYIFVANVYQESTNYVNGFHEVSAVDATNVYFHTNHLNDGAATPCVGPYSKGQFVFAALAIKACNDVVVTGLEIQYSGTPGGDKMACMCFDAETIVTNPNGVGNNLLFARNRVTAGCVGFANFRSSNEVSSGNQLQVEENAFTIGLNSFIPWQVTNKVGALYISGGTNFVVNRNTFSKVQIWPASGGAWNPDGVIQYTDLSPAIGHLFTSNSFGGASNINRQKLFHLWNDWMWNDPPLERIFVRRNTYADVETVTPQQVSSDYGGGAEPLYDREPETLIDEAFLPTQTDVIWQAPREELASFPGTAGETQALAVYAGRLHFDSSAAGSGTVVGVDGTPDNPVNDEADLMTLSVATNIRTVFVEGTFTVATDWEKFTFDGASPERSIILSALPHSLNDSEFTRCGIRGAISGRIATVECLIGGVGLTVSGVQGTFKETGWNGTIQIESGGTIQGLDLASQATTGATVIDFQNNPGTVIGEMKGLWAVENISGSPSGVYVVYALAGGQIWLKNTVSAGNFILLGQGEIFDEATGKEIFSDNVLRGSRLDVSTGIIEALINALNDIDSGDVTAAVWGITEAALAGAGATGLLVALAMSQNTQIDFTGDDALGWQLVINDTAGSEIGRADLYDEANARIPAAMTVAAFIAAQKTISRVVPS